MSRHSTDSFEKPDIEGKHYDPEGYEKLAAFRLIAIVVFIIAFVVIGATMIVSFGNMRAADSGADAGVGGVFFVFFLAFVVLGIMGFVYNSELEEHKEKIFAAKNAEQNEVQKLGARNNELLHNAHEKLKEQKNMIEAIQNAQTKGDIIISNVHAPVIISSTITNSFNAISTDEPELASAIKTLGGFIENSGNKDAAEYFNELHEHVAQEQRSPVTLKALWKGIVSSLPSVEKLTDVVTKITALFA